MRRNKKTLDSKDPRYMTEEQEQIVNLILSNNELKSGKDVSNIFNELRGKVIQRLLDAEMEEFLGYDKSKHGEKENKNRRNGYTSKAKKVKTDTGEITICPPRDREGKFEPQIVKKRQRVLEGFDEIAIAMYAKGMSLKDISEMIQHIYKVELSIETISKLTSSVSEEVQKWQERPLEKFYPFIYVDCLYAPVKRDLISEKVAIYVMLGINKDGKKDVLGIWINENESATFWTEVFEEIKARGVEEILFISLDGLSGLSEAIEKIYPKAKTQRCIVHIVRNIYGILDKKKSKEIIGDLKKIYTASNGNNAKLEYENFIEKYKSNEKLIKKLNLTHKQSIPVAGLTKKITTYISLNFKENITLDLLAKEFCVSKFYISHTFSEKLKVNLSEYVSSIRAKYAAEQLLSTDDSITNIALNSGFSSQSTFNRTFLKIYGMSPREYRNNF